MFLFGIIHIWKSKLLRWVTVAREGCHISRLTALIFADWTVPVLALEEVFIPMCRSSRVRIFRFSSKTQWQKGTNMASPYKFLILGDSVLRITQRPDSWRGYLYSNRLSYSWFLTLFIEWLQVFSFFLIAWLGGISSKSYTATSWIWARWYRLQLVQTLWMAKFSLQPVGIRCVFSAFEDNAAQASKAVILLAVKIKRSTWLIMTVTGIAELNRYVQIWTLMRFKFLMISITKCPHW